jgi:hypothetical protein
VGQAGGELVRAVVELGVGQGPVGSDDHRAVAEASGGLVGDVAEHGRIVREGPSGSATVPEPWT